MAKKKTLNIGIGIITDCLSVPMSGEGNILSIGASDGSFDFSINLHPLTEIANRRKGWDKNLELWEEIHKDSKDPKEAMEEFYEWLRKFNGVLPIAVGSGWDYWWLYTYLRKFIGKCPFENHFLDVDSYRIGRGRISNLGEFEQRSNPFRPAIEIAKERLEQLEKEGVEKVGSRKVATPIKKNYWDMEENWPTTINQNQMGNAPQTLNALQYGQDPGRVEVRPPQPGLVPTRRLTLRRVQGNPTVNE